MAYIPLMKKMEKTVGSPILRLAEKKAGPLITDNGNFILDVDFGEITDPKMLNQKIKLLSGVVETGLFIGMTEKVYFGQKDGSLISRKR